MTNEILFTAHVVWIGASVLAALFTGKEAIIAFTAIFTLLANLFVTKQITLFGLEVTATDAFAVGSVLGMNLLQEYFGNRVARQAIIIGFMSAIFFTITSIIHLCYMPNGFDQCHNHFLAILSPMPRLMIASLISYLLSQNLDYYLFTFFKQKFSKQGIVMRYCSSTALSQLCDTILFSFLGLYGIVHNIWHLIAVSYTIKLIVILASTPFAWISSSLVKGRS